MLRKVQQQKTSQRRSFSETGLEELVGLQTQLIANSMISAHRRLSCSLRSYRGICARYSLTAL